MYSLVLHRYVELPLSIQYKYRSNAPAPPVLDLRAGPLESCVTFTRWFGVLGGVVEWRVESGVT
jgi:hypothetical protein